MICLDTTFIIDLLNNDKAAVRIAVSIEGSPLFTTQINVFELLYGEFITNDKKKLEIFNRFNKFNCLIAGIAISHGITTILTRNVKDFSKIMGLTVQNY